MECRGGIEGVRDKCFCAPGLCYDAALQTCAEPKGDCQRGNREQKSACCRDTARRSLTGANAGGADDSESSLSSWRARRLGMQCTSTDSESDERVANFASALERSNHQTHEERDSFHAEYVTSVSNLFVRTVADVQAMFNVYFADDPNWDDDCYTLKPVFQVFHEYEDDDRQTVLEIQQQKSDKFVSHRVVPEGTIGQEGPELEDRDNPWCAWGWASRSSKPWHRAEFVKKDPPLGQQGHSGEARTARQLNGAMMPQLWCELASRFRSTNISRDRPFGETHYRRGWSVSFQATCSQLTLIMPLNRNSSQSRLNVWQRYDCESTVLSSAFITIFPKFASRVRDVRARLGELLEDTLQCAGRISGPVARQFPTRSQYVEQHCVVSTDEMVRRQGEITSTEREERSAFLESQARLALDILREWIDEVGNMGPIFVKDFQKAFAYGDRLTGLFYGSGGLEHMRQLFKTSEKIAERMSLLEDHLVEKAWQQRGQQNRALFPPPATYTTTTKTEIYVSAESRDICRITPQRSIVYAFLLTRAVGRTYELADGRAAAAESNSQRCAAGTFAPFNRLGISVTMCSRQVDVDGQLREEKTWDVELQSVLRVSDPLSSVGEPVSDLFSGQQPATDGSSIVRADRPMLAGAWAMASAMLASPGSFFGSVAGSVEDQVQRAYRNIMDRSSELLREAGSTLWDEATPIITTRNYRMLDVKVHIVRVGEDAYTPTFHATYKDATVGRLDVAWFNSPLALSAQMHVTWAYDLSEVMAIAYHAIQHQQAEQHFSNCAECLSRPGKVYCHDAVGSSDCVDGVHLCVGNKTLAISTAFDCDSVGGDDEDETNIEL